MPVASHSTSSYSETLVQYWWDGRSSYRLGSLGNEWCTSRLLPSERFPSGVHGMTFPVYSLADKGKFTEANPITSVRVVEIPSVGRCMLLFESKQDALALISSYGISDDAVPLQLSNKSAFIRLIEHAKRVGIEKIAEPPTISEPTTRISAIDSWLAIN